MSNSIDEQNTSADADFEATAVKFADLKLNRPRYVNVKGNHLVVALVDAKESGSTPELVAFSALCPHQMGELSGGMLGDGGIDCPLHFYRFDVRTGACMWFQGPYCGHGDVPLAQVIEICTRHGVPVLVDAAAQLPPVENLWNFTQMGATCAIFSGGKDLQGPQSSGMILGQRWLIEAIRPIGSPNAGIGRPMKVGKEEMVGLLAAVRRYLSLDHVARQARYERMVGDWGEAFSMLPGVHSERAFPNEAGQPLPRLEVRVGKGARLTHDQLLIALREGTPCIETEGSLGGDTIFINPWQLTDDEATIVERRVVELLS